MKRHAPQCQAEMFSPPRVRPGRGGPTKRVSAAIDLLRQRGFRVQPAGKRTHLVRKGSSEYRWSSGELLAMAARIAAEPAHRRRQSARRPAAPAPQLPQLPFAPPPAGSG